MPADRLRAAVIGVGHLGRHHARILEHARGRGARRRRRYRCGARGGGLGVDRRTSARGLPRGSRRGGRRHRSRCRPSFTATLRCRFSSAASRRWSRSRLHGRWPRPTSWSPPRASPARSLAVGQTERYNPAVAAVLPLVTSPRFIEVHRLGAFPDRSLDIDVVFDLMIHDLDIILALVRSDVQSIEAVGVPVLTSKYDIANARLRFASGCIANVTASRISKERVRKIRFFQPDAYISIDYAAQEVEGWRLVRRDGARPSIEGGALPVERDEPLRREIADFVRAVRSKTSPLVDGAAGRRALELATRVAEKMEQS